MKRTTASALAALLLLAACSKNTGQGQQTTSDIQGSSEKAKPSTQGQDINFTQENLFPEGLVYDKFNDRFYVSSTTRGDIGIVTRDGAYTAFITDPALVSTTGLEIDNARKLLYVANSTDGTVGLYNINTGQREAFIDLKPLLPGAPVFINDIALDPQGNAYVTNSRFPVIYKISREGTVSIFYQNPTFATSGFGFNGVEYSNANGGYLLVAFTSGNQVIKFPVADPSGYSVVALDTPLASPDGLLLSNSGKDLMVVNNAGGGPGKVVWFTSTDKWQSGTVATTFETGPVFPTSATSDGKNVYVLYAYLNKRGGGQPVNTYTIKLIPGTDKF